MIAVTIPGLPSAIQYVLFKLIYFDILFTEKWFPQLMLKFGLDIDNLLDDEPINLFFSENGFSSKQILKNAGSSLIFIVFFVFSWTVLLALKPLSGFSLHAFRL
jgi:hypothetical protein